MEESACFVGIHVGNMNATVALSKNLMARVVVSSDGRRLPCCVSFSQEGRLIGKAALNQAERNPKNTITGMKMMVGKRKSHFDDTKGFPFKIDGSDDGMAAVKVEMRSGNMIENEIYFPEDIIGMVISKMRRISESGGRRMEKVVLTVPVSFNEYEREAMHYAATVAGFSHVRLVSDNLAVAMAFYAKLNVMDKRKLLVLHIGANSCGAAIISLSPSQIESEVVSGMTGVGGIHVTNAIFTKILELIQKKVKIEEYRKERVFVKLWNACEKAKKELSMSDVTRLNIDALVDGEDFEMDLHRKDISELSKPLEKAVLQCLDEVIGTKTNEVILSEISDVVLSGGASRSPCVTSILAGKHEFLRSLIRRTINVDEATAEGAAICADILFNDDEGCLNYNTMKDKFVDEDTPELPVEWKFPEVEKKDALESTKKKKNQGKSVIKKMKFHRKTSKVKDMEPVQDKSSRTHRQQRIAKKISELDEEDKNRAEVGEIMYEFEILVNKEFKSVDEIEVHSSRSELKNLCITQMEWIASQHEMALSHPEKLVKEIIGRRSSFEEAVKKIRIHADQIIDQHLMKLKEKVELKKQNDKRRKRLDDDGNKETDELQNMEGINKSVTENIQSVLYTDIECEGLAIENGCDLNTDKIGMQLQGAQKKSEKLILGSNAPNVQEKIDEATKTKSKNIQRRSSVQSSSSSVVRKNVQNDRMTAFTNKEKDAGIPMSMPGEVDNWNGESQSAHLDYLNDVSTTEYLPGEPRNNSTYNSQRENSSDFEMATVPVVLTSKSTRNSRKNASSKKSTVGAKLNKNKGKGTQL